MFRIIYCTQIQYISFLSLTVFSRHNTTKTKQQHDKNKTATRQKQNSNTTKTKPNTTKTKQQHDKNQNKNTTNLFTLFTQDPFYICIHIKKLIQVIIIIIHIMIWC